MFEGLLQPGHLILILAIALLVFGPKKLPELGRGLGESIRGFREAMRGEEETAGSRMAGRQPPPAESEKSPPQR